MSYTSPVKSAIKPIELTFDPEILELDTSANPRGVWMDFLGIVYALEGRGKSTYLKSVVDAWGAESIVALDMERRLSALGVPRVTLPDMSEFAEEEQYARYLAWLDIIIDRAEKRAAPFGPNTKVIAIDTLNTFYDKLHLADLTRRYIGKNTPREQWVYQFQWYNPLYDDLFKRWNRLVKLTKMGYSVIINAHVKPTKRKINGEDVDRMEPALPPAVVQRINREAHTIFYMQASSGDSPNYFVTYPINDTIPAKDQLGVFPRRFWPTWAAVEACQLGNDWKGLKPIGITFDVKKEEKK